MTSEFQSIFDRVRSLAIGAVFSDSFFFDRVVLKGGNAIALAYDMSNRTSLDIDLSIEFDFSDLDEASQRLERACARHFLPAGFTIFDFKFLPRPSVVQLGKEKWGGYQAEFKVVTTDTYLRLKSDLNSLRRSSMVVGPDEMRKVRIDLSKYEYVAGKILRDFEDGTIYVYSPMMLAVEKLRAICQQMPAYSMRRNACPRARDFFDITTLVVRGGVYLASSEAAALARNIFDAKAVPLQLLSQVNQTREFHRPDWDSVRLSSNEELPEFDYFFDYVCHEIELLKTSWNI
jgi:predicted nucleotidyltransferase component of viral defense system